MCTVIVRVPDVRDAPVRILAVRDEDPARPWDRLGAWWPDAYPGVVGVRDARAGGAWLAADPARRRVAVIANRIDLSDRTDDEVVSRGGLVLDAVEGTLPGPEPTTRGFNLVQAESAGVRVAQWDGLTYGEQLLTPGTHMIAHDDIDDLNTERIAYWLDDFRRADATASGPRWWEPWLEVIAESAQFPPVDGRAIIRDNRPMGYPTQSLLLCAASITADGVDVHYGELDEPGQWNAIHLE